jgi:hypothetical protein
LRGRRSLDEAQLDVVGETPFGEGLRAKLGAIVESDGTRQASKLCELFHNANRPRHRQGVHLNRESFSIAFIDHVQRTKNATAVERSCM